MNQVESLENNRVKLTFSVDPDTFEKGLQHAYHKNKGKIFVSGFRKGKAPRKIIEVQYGKEIFYEDAAEFVFPDAYRDAVKELNIEPVSQPDHLDILEVSAEKGVQFTLEVTTKPTVTVDDYYGFTYKKPDISVTDADVDHVLNRDREKNARLISVDRPIQESDSVILDFEGFINGVPFEGGTGKDFDLLIGSHQFIDNFEEQLIQHSAGDNVDVTVTFPSDYGKAELAGQEALFKVLIKDVRVKELPTIDDDFAQDISEFDTLDELKEDLRGKIAADKEQKAKSDIENQLLTQLIQKAVMDVPDVMYETQINEMLRSFSQQLMYQGISLEMYAKHMGITVQALREMYTEEAQKRVKGSLALEAVAKKEAIDVGDDEWQAEIEKMATQYKMSADEIEKMLQNEDRANIRQNLIEKKALQLIQERAIEEAN